MKRLIVSGIISLLLIAFCIFGSVATRKLSDDFSRDISEIIELIEVENYSSALQKSQSLSQKWNKYEPLLSVFHSSTALHNIEGQIEKTAGMIKQQIPETVSELLLLKYQVMRIKLDEQLTVESWF